MTKIELAKEIYDMYSARGMIMHSSRDQWASAVVKGLGYPKPPSKQYLQEWHDRLASEM